MRDAASILVIIAHTQEVRFMAALGSWFWSTNLLRFRDPRMENYVSCEGTKMRMIYMFEPQADAHQLIRSR